MVLRRYKGCEIWKPCSVWQASSATMQAHISNGEGILWIIQRTYSWQMQITAKIPSVAQRPLTPILPLAHPPAHPPARPFFQLRRTKTCEPHLKKNRFHIKSKIICYTVKKVSAIMIGIANQKFKIRVYLDYSFACSFIFKIPYIEHFIFYYVYICIFKLKVYHTFYNAC